MNEFGGANEIVLDRAAREEGLQRLSLRPDALFTKGTLIKLGTSLDADYLCYGTYDVSLPTNNSPLRSSSIQISARFLDLRKLQDGATLLEAGKLTDLSRLEEHLAWGSLKYLQPGANISVDAFMQARKLTRLDAEESYIRGLLSSSKEQQRKWFTQASVLDPQFAAPALELGKLALEQKNYRQAIMFLGRVPGTDPRYAEARFAMGLAAYRVGDYAASAENFRTVAKIVPLSEVYNNLGAAEDRLNLPAAFDDFRRALDGDKNDTAYLFNFSIALLKQDNFDEASARLRDLAARDPDDAQVGTLLERAKSRQVIRPGDTSVPPERLKDNFDETAFRELKAMLQPKKLP